METNAAINLEKMIADLNDAGMSIIVQSTYHTDAEYLGEVLLAEGLVEGDESEYGLMITTVDGEQAVYETDGAYWAFYVGDEYASLGVDQTPIAEGDSFSLVYTVG